MEQGDEGRRQGRRGRRQRRDVSPGAGHAARARQGPQDRRAGHEVRLAAIHRDRREIQRSRTLHGDDRLRVDLGAGRQQPAPQRAVPRRQGQGRPGLPVLRLAERGPGEALGVDGPVRDQDRRPPARDPAQRQSLQRAHVRVDRLLRPAAHARLRRAPRPLGSAAGNRPDQGQQRDSPDARRRTTSSPGTWASPAGNTAT